MRNPYDITQNALTKLPGSLPGVDFTPITWKENILSEKLFNTEIEFYNIKMDRTCTHLSYHNSQQLTGA